jgi:murein DD-endopeptidase MepM/ murein hydrolase activator NlpD
MTSTMLRYLAPFLLASLLAMPATAQNAPVLSFPADCTIGADCWILSFVDLDATEAYTDHACGARTYADHKGTDIALTDAFDMARAVAVRAAADGIVRGARDGEPDNRMDAETGFTTGKECGNGVLLDHGNGWTTQYCHLLNGSVTARAGQTVRAGAVLGAIGNSGASETPHVHFQLAKDGAIVDPFTGFGPSDTAVCGAGASLWSDAALAAFGDYRSSFIRMAGFATGKMTVRDAQGTPAPARLPRDAEALTFHAMVYGASKDGVLTLEMYAPNGELVVDHEVVLDSRKARQFSLVGRRTPVGGWPPGAYRGIARFTHAGDTTVRIATVILE